MSDKNPTSHELTIKAANKLAGNLIDDLKRERAELLFVVKMILWCKPHKVSLDALKDIARKTIIKIESK